jgi:hypothetical protein
LAAGGQMTTWMLLKTSPTRVVFDSIWMDGLEMIRCATSVDFSMSMSG